MVMPAESPPHRELKRLALIWARGHGYPIAAPEVSVPNFRVRLDAAAYRPGGSASVPAVGLTAVFECKASRPDYLRDSRSLAATAARLAVLAARRSRLEQTLRLHCPSIRNGDSLFAEWETLDFHRPGYEAYEKVMAEMRRLSARLHDGTKFERLTKWRAANLFYLVVEPGLFRDHELPIGWGVLLRRSDTLELRERPHFHVIEETPRLALLHRIARAATRSILGGQAA